MAARSAGALALALALLAGGTQARAAGPTPTSHPTVSGTVAAGNRLLAGSGTWTSSTPIQYAYQWYRCDPSGARCSSVHGATGPGYPLGAKDVGRTIALAVTASDGTGSTVAYASLVGPVAPPRPLLVSTAQPQVTGLAIEGETLQLTTGAWSPAPAAFAYAWQRCNPNGRACAPIAGAHASSYTIGGADAGHALAGVVSATFGSTTQAAFSTASAVVLGGDVSGPTHSAGPAITGVAVENAQLGATTGVWSGMGSLAYRYQWYRCDASAAHCLSIHGATKTTYRTVAADVGKTLAFTVRATDSTGTASAYSSVVGPIAPAGSSIAATAQPTVTGTPHPGSRLAVGTGLWQPPAGALTYAWRRCNANGRLCAPIAGATLPTYTVTADDAGHALVAVVTATVGATVQRSYSVATPAVA